MRKKILFICLSWLIALTANADNLRLYLKTVGLTADPNSSTPYATTDTNIEEGTVVTIMYKGNDNTTTLSIYINGEVVSSGTIFRKKNDPYIFTAKRNCILRVEGKYAFNFSTNPNVYFTQDVDVDVTGVTLSQTEAAMTVGGDALTLTATVAPDNATDKTVTWTTSDANVATVTDGVVTAVAAGTATITATATNGTAATSDDKTATCEVTVSNPTVTANEGATGEYWATYYNGTTSFTADENTTVFQAALSGSSLTLTEVPNREIPATKAVILKSSSATITLTPASTTETLEGNELQGTATSITNPGNAYVLNKTETNGVGFYKLSSTGTIGANKAYLTYSGASLARSFFGFDETTGIEMPTAEVIDADAVVYDLQGRRVAQPTKGLYIMNGKKVVIK